jgi:transmembrane sensor
MNNVLEFETRAAVEQQAREWLIRLDGDSPLKEVESRSLHEWLDQHPSHRAELTRLAQFWNQANVLTELAVPFKRAAAISHRRRSRHTPLLLAASVLVAAVILVAWRFQLVTGASNGTYGTVIGEQRTIALPDGSTIELNTDSQAQVGYSPTERKIRLLRGEALFTVAHNALRPFEVYAGNAVVRAVGTAFSVNIAEQKIAVTVTKGVVEVAEVGSGPAIDSADERKRDTPPHKLGTLKAGQTTTVGNEPDNIQVQVLPEPELARRMAWQEGYLVFSGEPLSEVVTQVNRYSPMTLQIADPQLASIAIGGRFRIGDLGAVLDVLRDNFGIQSAQVDERNIRLSSTHRR